MMKKTRYLFAITIAYVVGGFVEFFWLGPDSFLYPGICFTLPFFGSLISIVIVNFVDFVRSRLL